MEDLFKNIQGMQSALRKSVELQMASRLCQLKIKTKSAINRKNNYLQVKMTNGVGMEEIEAHSNAIHDVLTPVLK